MISHISSNSSQVFIFELKNFRISNAKSKFFVVIILYDKFDCFLYVDFER